MKYTFRQRTGACFVAWEPGHTYSTTPSLPAGVKINMIPIPPRVTHPRLSLFALSPRTGHNSNLRRCPPGACPEKSINVAAPSSTLHHFVSEDPVSRITRYSYLTYHAYVWSSRMALPS
jgi:hypothetical protein